MMHKTITALPGKAFANNKPLWPDLMIGISWTVALLLLLLMPIQSDAQTTGDAKQTAYTISGVVADSIGQPLAGVSIFSNDRIAGLSDDKGKFDLKVPAGAKVQFSYIGYNSFTLIVSKEEKKLQIRLRPTASNMNDVVVTALGIEREKKSLGYAAQQIDGSEVQDAPANNWVNALDGKVPGMVLNTADGPMGSSDIILRGDKSLSLGSSGALIVIDGVVISNDPDGSGAKAYSGNTAPTDFGSTMTDINPDDIENISVLKGPGATALYGARGANGAIIVTTKSGGARKGLGVTFSSNTRIDMINRWPDYQSEYGPSGISSFDYYSFKDSEDGRGIVSVSDFGAKFNTGVKYFQYDPVTHEQSAERLPWVNYPDNRREFFRTGITTTNSIAIEGGNNTTKARLSINNLVNKYMLPNTGYQRTSINLSLSHKLSDKIRLDAKVNYNHKTSDNLPNLAYSNKSITYFIMTMSPNMDSKWFKDYWITKDVQQRRIFSGIVENPYFALYEELNTLTRDGVYGNINFTYEITKNLTLTAKSGVDMYEDINTSRQPKSSNSYANGFYKEQNIFRNEMNTDFLLSYNGKINEDWKLGASAGGNRMNYKYNRTKAYHTRLDVPGQYTLSNGIERPIMDPYKSEKSINSLYGFANLSFREMIFLELTGRNDWSSALPTNNNAYFYPSVNSSIVLSDLFKWHNKALSYLKLRLSYAQVGNDTYPYRAVDFYEPNDFPYSLTNPTTKADVNLRPERTRSYEVGLEGTLFQNMAGFDITTYRADTYDQILSVPVERASGYYNAVMNAGTVRNEGIELQLWVKPIYKKLKWRITVNAASNRGKILELADNIESIAMYSGPGGATILGVEGGKMGDIYGLGYERNGNGDIVYEGGLPLLGTDIVKRGNVIPQWKGGIMNQFRYKNWSLKVLFDGEFGFDKYSLSFSRMMALGKLKQTLPGRESGALLGVGVVKNEDGTYRPNDVAVLPSEYYPTTYQRSNAEANIMDATFIKLREVTLSYTIKSKYLAKMGISNPTVGVYGRNLFIWTKWPVYDPESGTLDQGIMVRGLDIGQFPSTRTIGVNLKLSF